MMKLEIMLLVVGGLDDSNRDADNNFLIGDAMENYLKRILNKAQEESELTNAGQSAEGISIDFTGLDLSNPMNAIAQALIKREGLEKEC